MSTQNPKQAAEPDSKQQSEGSSPSTSKQEDKQNSTKQADQPRRKPPKLGPKRTSKQPPKLGPKQSSKQPPKLESKQSSTQPSEKSSSKPPEQPSEQSAKPESKQLAKPTSEQPSEQPSNQAPVEEQEDESKDGEDLTTILDESQRGDFTLLLANATQSMRKLIEENFNPSAGLNKALLRENMSEDDKLMSADIDPGTADVSALDRERKLKEQFVKELGTPKMQNLKKDALKAFDEWRQTVIERVGQVVNSERTVKGQVEKEAKAGKAQPQAPDQNPLGSVVKTPPNENVKLKFKDLYPPTKTPLTKMSMQQRTLLVHSLLLLLLSLEHYTAPSRVLLLHLTSSLKIPLKTFEQDETTVAKGLLEAAKEMTADEETKKKAEANKENRKWKVGLASAAGAAIIGISGGMAAPLVSAGVGTIMGSLGLGATAAAGYLGSVAGSTVLVGGLFGAYGGRMTGEMMDKYAREVEDFEFLPVHSRNKTSEKAEEGAKQATEHNHKLRVTICISGWLTEKDEVVRPWKVIGRGAEVFALKWELEALLNLGNAMNGLVQSAAWGYAQKQMIQQTIFADLMAAMWPIGLIKAAGVIDNPFSVAKASSEKAGEVLADALINRAQGERPVTLIGYSLGARVIYTCLMSLAKRKAFGLVESAVLIGSPTPSDTSDWRIMRTAVSARLVNVYSENDYVLGFMYRTSSIQYGVAGLQKVEGLSGVENVNVSEDVQGHLRYRYLIGSILKKIGFEDIDMEAVEEEHVALEKMEEEEKKNSLRAQKNRLLRRESTGGKEDEAKEAEEEADDIQKQVAAKTEKSLVTRAVEYFYLPKTPSTKDIENNLGNIQKAAADPSEAGSVAIEAVKDIQASGQSYAQWAALKLPSLSGKGGGAAKKVSDPSKATAAATDAASKTADGAASTTQSYTQAAASYLPSFGSAKKKAQDPAKAAEDVGKGATDTVKQVPGVENVKDTTKPSLDEASKTTSDVASAGKEAAEGAGKKGEEAIDQTPAKDVKNATKSTIDDTSKGAGDTAEGVKDTAGGAAAKGQAAAGDAPASAQKTAEDTASSAQSYTQRAAGYLPSLGGKGKKAAGESKNTVEKAAKAPTKPAGDTPKKPPASAESYTSKAAGYLPSFGSSKKRADETAKKAGDTAKDSSVKASDAAKEPAKAATEATMTPSKIAAKATDTVEDTTKGKTPSVPDAKKTVTDPTSSVQDYKSRAAGYLQGMPGRRKASVQVDSKRKGSNAGRTDSPKPPPIIHQDSTPKKEEKKVSDEKGADSKPEGESLISRASSYLPSTPSIPGLSRGKSDNKPKPPAPNRIPSESQKNAPKLDRKPSEQTPKPAAKLPRKPSSAAATTTTPTKPPPSKLERKGSEAPPSASTPATSPTPTPTPKLSRQASEAKKSIPKLDRKPTGMETPSPSPSSATPTTKKLERTASGMQKSIPKLDRLPSGVKSPSAKLGRTAEGVQSPAPVSAPVAAAAEGMKGAVGKYGEVLGKGGKGLGSGLGSVGSVFGGGGGGGGGGKRGGEVG